MKAPIPPPSSFWWNDTDGLRDIPLNLTFSQSQRERWWDDSMLDQRAAELLALHPQSDTHAPWLSEAELAELNGERTQYRVSFTTPSARPYVPAPAEKEQWNNSSTSREKMAHKQLSRLFRLRNKTPKVDQDIERYLEIIQYERNNRAPLPDPNREVITVPLALLTSFSRRVKESDFFEKLEKGPQASFLYQKNYMQKVEEWRGYLSVFWTRHSRERMRGIGSDAQVFKATKVFFHWMKTGNIVVQLDELVDKQYLLLFARGVGSPLFRAAILEQIPLPPISKSTSGEPIPPQNRPETLETIESFIDMFRTVLGHGGVS